MLQGINNNMNVINYLILKKHIILLVFFMSLIGTVKTQNFKEGWVLLQKGDTLRGWIDFQKNDRNNRVCNFKSSFDSEVVQYRPNDILGYRILSYGYYKSSNVQFHEGDQNTYFVEYIVSGVISLIKVEDRFFVEKEKGELKELYIEEKIIDKIVGNTSRRYLQKSTHHLGILRFMMSDCPSVEQLIGSDVGIFEKPLTNLLKKYHECIGVDPIIYKEKLPWTKILVGMRAGGFYSNLQFNDPSVYRVIREPGSIDGSGPFGGLFVEIVSPRLNNRLSIILEGHISYNKFKAFYEDTDLFTRYYETDFEVLALNVPFGLRHNFQIGNMWSHIELGGFYRRNLTYNTSYIIESLRDLPYLSNIEVDTELGEAFQPVKSNTGIWGGIGIKPNIGFLKNLSIDIRYERNTVVLDELRSIISPKNINENKINNIKFSIGWIFIN